MAKQRGRRRRTPSKKQDYPGWLWMVFGLAIGLSVALAIYVRDREPAPPPAAVRQPASLENAIDDNGERASAEQPAPEQKEGRFTFYDMLPNFEVVIPEQEPDVTADVEPRPVVTPGLYVLQAGSFTRYEDADRRRAELALQGIESTIQRVTIDDNTYHRVRIGPLTEVGEVNRIRARLRNERIDSLVIKLPN